MNPGFTTYGVLGLVGSYLGIYFYLRVIQFLFMSAEAPAARTGIAGRLTIGASGDLSGLSIARSSGIPELDQAVVEGIRRAAPFPRLPVEWGKPVWSFSQDVQVTGH